MGTVVSLEERTRETPVQRAHDELPETTDAAPRGRLARFLDGTLAKRLGHKHLTKLLAQRGQVAAAWRELPDRMHLVANQTQLMMELVDDFRAGTYRKIPWRSLAVCAAAILYVASPADVIPDMLVGIGLLDDLAIAALAARAIESDLRAYCEFKGYDSAQYFTG